MIEQDIDSELDWLAAEEGISKAALIQRYIREHVQPLQPLTADPLAAMVGADDFEPGPVEDIVCR